MSLNLRRRASEKASETEDARTAPEFSRVEEYSLDFVASIFEVFDIDVCLIVNIGNSPSFFGILQEGKVKACPYDERSSGISLVSGLANFVIFVKDQFAGRDGLSVDVERVGSEFEFFRDGRDGGFLVSLFIKFIEKRVLVSPDDSFVNNIDRRSFICSLVAPGIFIVNDIRSIINCPISYEDVTGGLNEPATAAYIFPSG
jgi:hypothetical protein